MNHPFADGNKRTASLAENEYLRGYGAWPFVNADLQYAVAHMQAIGSAHSLVAQNVMDVDDLANAYAQALGMKQLFPRTANLVCPSIDESGPVQSLDALGWDW
ncbi:hypothetical protein CERSUDRAFT_92715 [Gelatoporia subvermispora B]|uniref:Fido domain-containing protein n=1 Tax=Ceriporiopsis subvermispora (strain B) TaxID=914234 RepID=M2RMX4_CERS8|nr:hypothetical protein CERSUDRAFT_92715 [Gelatoporia subvermispora B]